MPGIMPMKIIKVGTSSQSRVAQACDRCRSKKIRCDGVTPCCTQCANVGFECKTSDKLSRRAFPRGYTESLEERVRQLEAEVRDLKDLLDEKDEKIDLLSKFHDFSTNRRRSEASTGAKAATQQAPEASDGEADDVFAIKQPSSLTKTSSRTEPHWAGASSSTSFLDVFKEKAAASGRAVPPISPRALFTGKGLSTRRPVGGHARRPPRLVSDRLVNVYFQEFAPLFPILYRPAFLQRYREFTEGSDSIENHHAVAQLNLVFSIAATAGEFGKEHVPAFDNHWQSALSAVVHNNSLSTLQCLVLAQLCCLCKGDSNRVLHYAGLAIIMSRRLGLHKLQASLSLDALTTELRKRTFWCLYTLDTFTAAYLGLPRLIKDEVVQTETPINVDDEDLVEQRLTSTTTETKMSASLALFGLARIFARVIDTVYQAPAASGISLQTVAGLSDALNAWQQSLAPHLRLTFSQDKPSTRVTGDRSPLLSLAYYHVRALLHRPLATSDLGSKAMPSAIVLADSSKHIVQIVQLLDERHMGFTLPMSRNEVLVTAGLGLLYQGLTIAGKPVDGSPTTSSIVNENQRLVCTIMNILDSATATCAGDFKAIACAIIAVDGLRIRRSPSTSQGKSISPRSSISQVSAAHSSATSLSSARSSQSPEVRQCSAESAASSPKKLSTTIAQRRSVGSPGKLCFPSSTAMNLNHQDYAFKGGLTPIKSEPSLRAAAATAAAAAQQMQVQQVDSRRADLVLTTGDFSNLDYLPLGNEVSPVPSLTPVVQKSNAFDGVNPSQWDDVLGCLGGNGEFNDPSMSSSPTIDVFSPAHSVIDTGVSASGLGSLDWTGQDPISATAWTDSTGVSSVFDDSGASLISGDDGRSSIDFGKGGTAELSREIDYLAGTSSLDLNVGLADELAGLHGLEACLQI